MKTIFSLLSISLLTVIMNGCDKPMITPGIEVKIVKMFDDGFMDPNNVDLGLIINISQSIFIQLGVV